MATWPEVIDLDKTLCRSIEEVAGHLLCGSEMHWHARNNLSRHCEEVGADTKYREEKPKPHEGCLVRVLPHRLILKTG